METAGLERRRDPLEVAWASLTFLIPAIVSLLSRMGSIDLAYHLRAGEDVLHGNIPRVDTYTFTIPGNPWLDQQWLAQAFLAFAHRLGGWPSLLALQAVLVGATFWLVYLAPAQRAPARGPARSSRSQASWSRPPGVLRPQLLAMPLFGLLLWVVAGRALHPGGSGSHPFSPPSAPTSTAASCCSRSSSASPGSRIARRDTRSGRTLLVGVVTAAATLATPFGPRAWVYVYDVSTNPVIRKTITEWAPLTLATVPGWLAIGSAFAVVAYLVRRGRPTPWTALITLGLFLLLALSAQRGIVWWGMVAPVVVAGLIRPLVGRKPEPGGVPRPDRPPT